MAITRIGNIASTITDSSVQNVKMSNLVQSKNIIINGSMDIAQRATSVSSISSGNTIHTCDRWKTYASSAGTWTQPLEALTSGDPYTNGFATSLKLDCTTANGSLSSGSYLQIAQSIEAQNLQYIKKGTSNAEQLTASFWVKSTKTGTNILQFVSLDNTVRICAKSYTINSSDTWEKKTITFNGNTSNSFTNDANLSLDVRWWLESGSDFTSGTPSGDWEANDNTKRNNNNLALSSSTSNEFYITGVQLEAGQTASEFEFLPHDINLRRCLRYYYSDDCDLDITIRRVSDSSRGVHKTLPVPMRTAPTFTAVTSVEIGNTSMSDSSDKSVRFTMSGNPDNNLRYTAYNFSADL